ncbi:unnamed protein product [Brassicogethes aeneus]|uniref:Cytochrome c oxidase polypeptide VIa n=1 Tax=Brassicogethes aeneus TaxID=1431903 RepID=A0A9P0BAD6_BRAAE|nr:unnamed protein product [Brassicogethes aeneus]
MAQSTVFRRLFQTTVQDFAKCERPQDPPHKGGGYKIYKKLVFLVGLPAVLMAAAYTYMSHQRCHHERPEFVKYPYLRIRSKRYPWGDGNRTFFHNCEVNALPDGYEDCEKCDDDEAAPSE